VPAFSRLNSFGCISSTNFVRVGIGVTDPHQHSAAGQKQR